MTPLPDVLETLETAEDFLEHFGIDYDARVVAVNRLHILQRFHDRLAAADLDGLDAAGSHEAVSALLARAYRDFVASDARTEKVFKVFHDAERKPVPGTTVVPLAAVRGAAGTNET